MEADIVIVGGGITGITLAYLFVQENLKPVILEANRILYGTTGHTTAKITAQHGLIYDELIRRKETLLVIFPKKMPTFIRLKMRVYPS